MPAALLPLARGGEQRLYARGRVLIHEGDYGDSIFIILAGRLRAFSRHAESDREITYGIYGPGEYVGEMGLDGGERSASVEALEDCVCVRVERRTLEAHIAQNPALAVELLSKVIRRARHATLGMKQMAMNDVYGRIRLLLESLAVTGDDGARTVQERLTHRDIAQRLGCGREMVSRVMKDLERGGYVSRTARGELRLAAVLPSRW